LKNISGQNIFLILLLQNKSDLQLNAILSNILKGRVENVNIKDKAFYNSMFKI
jgi:hypothetical protein